MTLPALRRVVAASGTLGGVAAGSGLAAAAGTATLLDGGNAFDAVLAAALMETVALPPKCGLAGDLVALYITPDSVEPTALVSVGGAAAGLNAAAAQNDWKVSSTGGLSVGVPGAPAGYAAVGELGRLPLDRVAAPAIALAERGIVWTAVLERLAREGEQHMLAHQPRGCTYRPIAGPHTAGDRLRLPGLATMLRAFVERRGELFFDEIGAQVCDYVADHGGVLTLDDMRSVVVEVGPAPRVDVAGAPLWSTPSPTYGSALHRAMTEHAVGVDLPTAVRDAMAELRHGQPAELTGGTSAVAAADGDGNVVVLVHSNSFPQFGSGLVVPGLDLILSNRAGRGFTFLPDHPNSPAPGRRPLTTLHAWATTAVGGYLFGATPGGEQQVPWNAQTVSAVLAGDTPAEAITRPRWELDSHANVVTEGVDLVELGARSSHVAVQTGRGVVTVTADPRLDGRAVAV